MSALPGAEAREDGRGVRGVGGEATDDRGLKLDVLEPMDNGEHNSAGRGWSTATVTIPAFVAAVSMTFRGLSIGSKVGREFCELSELCESSS